MDSFFALYSVYFETLRFVDPQFRVSLEAQRSRLPPEASGVLEIGDALDVLSRSRDDHHALHASLALAWAHWGLAHQLAPTREIERARDRIAAYLHGRSVDLDAVTRAPKGGAAYLVPLADQGCGVKNFWVRTRFHSGVDVSTCAAGVEVPRAVEDFSVLQDPRQWSTRAPETFASTYRIVESPVDPDSDPPDADAGGPVPPLGEPWSGLLFEEAHWPIGAVTVKVRNSLVIDYKQMIASRGRKPQGARLFLQYSLYECLTHHVTPIGGSGYGGIDRDSGFSDVRSLASGATSLAALKSIRFTGKLDWLNALTPAYLFTWISLAVMIEACYGEAA
jgi:hypothetical protein